MKILKSLFLCGFILSVMACDDKINLDLNDKRPVNSVLVNDAEEVAILQQELEIEVKYVNNNTLYFYANEATLSKLKDIGYLVSQENPMQTSFKTVKLLSKYNNLLKKEKNLEVSKELLKNKIKILNREDDHWIIYGTLEDLKKIERLGFKLENLEIEIHPRTVKITGASVEDIQIINEMNVDIYSSELNGNYLTVYGGAYDYQIDRLRDAGFEVSIEN